jgi:hypothetical protein
MREGLIHFFGVQVAVTQHLTGKQEDRYFVPVARPRLRVRIHIHDIDGDPLG